MQWSVFRVLALASCLKSISALPVTDNEKRMTLPVIKTTKTNSGLIVDWVQLEAQGEIASPPPAPHRKRTESNQVQPNVNALFSGDHVERGPVGTVPIARPAAGLIKAKKQLPNKQLPNTSLPSNDTDPAALTSYAGNHWYASSAQAVDNHGGQGVFSLFKAFVENPGDFSLLQTAVIRYDVPQAGSSASTSQTVEAGWINYPNQVSAPHLFTFFTTNGYTSDGDQIGGWNRDQVGWVQVDSTIFPGTAFNPLSTEGSTQYELEIEYLLFEGNWWLWVLDRWIGYYPASVFTKNGVSSSSTLQDHSSQINFYGEIFQTETGLTTTDMGSGEFPEGGFGHSAYIHNIAYTDTNGAGHNYDGSKQIIVSDSSRYRIDTSFNSGESWGSYFYLGGPGAGGIVNA